MVVEAVPGGTLAPMLAAVVGLVYLALVEAQHLEQRERQAITVALRVALARQTLRELLTLTLAVAAAVVVVTVQIPQRLVALAGMLSSEALAVVLAVASILLVRPPSMAVQAGEHI